jgi:heme-degrading monooxygenase HmoA
VPTISADADVVVLINTFTCTAERREQVMEALGKLGPIATAAPGFLSASIHVGLDGTRVVNYVQWRSVEDVKAFVADQRLQAALASLKGVATVDPQMYRVVRVVEGAAPAD